MAVIGPCTFNATRSDAERVASHFNAAPHLDRSTFGRYGPATAGAANPGGGMTDIGEAVESAVALSLAAPFPPRRSLLNLLPNGVDNDGPSPDAVRDHPHRLGRPTTGTALGDGMNVV